ncbi:MAG TPA: thiol reductant ABC exporter subunit CydD [Anaerolineaceae bacterium]
MPRPSLFSLLPRRLLTPASAPLTLAVLLSLGSGLLILAQAELLSRIIRRVFLEGQGLDSVFRPLTWLLIVILARAGLVFGGEVAARFAAIRVKARVREALVCVLLAIGPAHPGQERTGELVNTAAEGVEALDAYFSQYLPQLALAALLPMLLLAAVFPLDRLTGVVLLVTAPLIPLFMALIGNLSQTVTRRQWQALSRLSAHFLDSLQGLVTLKQLGRSQAQIRAMDRVSQQYRAATLGVLRVSFLSAFTLELIATLSTAIIAVEISLRLLGGQIAFEQALFLLVLAPDFYVPLRTLGARFHAGAAGIAAARRITELLAAPLPIEPAAPAAIPAAPWTIRFEDVSYTYPGSPEPVLDCVSFELRPGEQTALMGASGAGKSTIARLLLAFIRPDAGHIWIGDTPLENIPAAAWRTQVGWVPQDACLFSGTLEENLRLADPAADEEKMNAALYKADLLDAVRDFPSGLQTPIGEQGARLSGGERQRLGIARAILKGTPIVLLDEPTAFLDPELEDSLSRAIQTLSAGHTVLTIAHRLPTVLRADHILVLDGGRIVQAGSPAELSTQEGVYRRMAQTWEGSPA